MHLFFRLNRFLSSRFTKYEHHPIEGYDFKSHIPLRKGKKRFLIEKETLKKRNSEPITVVIISDAEYFLLAYEQVKTIFLVEPESEVFLFDAGLKPEQRNELLKIASSNIHFETFVIETLMQEQNLRRNEAMFYFKIHAVSIVVSKCKSKIVVYSDAANVFLKPLNELKNFVDKYGFYAGMTEMFSFERIQKYKQFRDCADDCRVPIFDKQFLLFEGGFWAVDISKSWVLYFLNEYKEMTKKHHGVFQIFPHDMVAMSLLLYKYSKLNNLIFQELPNIRFNAILEKATVKEKNAVVFDYTIEKIPFFGYAVHNCSNHPDAPEKRKCKTVKADITEYLQK